MCNSLLMQERSATATCDLLSVTSPRCQKQELFGTASLFSSSSAVVQGGSFLVAQQRQQQQDQQEVQGGHSFLLPKVGPRERAAATGSGTSFSRSNKMNTTSGSIGSSGSSSEDSCSEEMHHDDDDPGELLTQNISSGKNPASSSSTTTANSGTLLSNDNSKTSSLMMTVPSPRLKTNKGTTRRMMMTTNQEEPAFFLSCPAPPSFWNMPSSSQEQDVQRQRPRTPQEDESLLKADITGATTRSSGDTTPITSSAAVYQETTRIFVPIPNLNLQGHNSTTRKRRAFDNHGPLMARTYNMHDDHCIDDDGTGDGFGSFRETQLLQQHLKCTPPSSPSSPSTRIHSRCITSTSHMSHPAHPSAVGSSVATTSASAVATLQSTTTSITTTPIPFSRTTTPPILPFSMTTSASPFSTSTYSKELSRIGNLTIQSPGSSFTAYHSPAHVKHGCPSPTCNNNKNTNGVPQSSSDMLPALQKQNPRHVPIAFVTRPASNHDYREESPVLIPTTTAPFHCVQKDDDHYHKYQRSSHQDNYVPTNVEKSQCRRHSFLSSSHSSSDSLEDDVNRKSRDGRNDAKVSPPVSFLDFSQNEGNFGRQQKSQISSFTSLLKQKSNDSLDDFFFSDDVSLGSSLTESGDEGDWFFLCQPKFEASPTDCAHHWKMPRSSFLHENPRRIPKLPFPTTTSTNSNVAPTSTNDDYVTFSTRFISKNVPTSTTKSQYSSSSTLFGMGIPQANSKASFNDEQTSSYNVAGPRQQQKMAPFSTVCRHESLSSQSLQNVVASSSNATTSAGGSDVLIKTTTTAPTRDLVTPPVSLVFQETNEPPPLKKASYHMKSIASFDRIM